MKKADEGIGRCDTSKMSIAEIDELGSTLNKLEGILELLYASFSANGGGISDANPDAVSWVIMDAEDKLKHIRSCVEVLTTV